MHPPAFSRRCVRFAFHFHSLNFLISSMSYHTISQPALFASANPTQQRLFASLLPFFFGFHPHGVGRVGMHSLTGREYAAADARWGTADSTVVSLELLTVFGAGPLAALIVYQIVKRDPARHYWIVVLSTAELYGGYVLFLLLLHSSFFLSSGDGTAE